MKRISLIITSTLERKTVLETVVTKAMRLLKKSRLAHIFLYDKAILRSFIPETAVTFCVQQMLLPINRSNIIAGGIPLHKPVRGRWTH